jgi:hypothetical protein
VGGVSGVSCESAFVPSVLSWSLAPRVVRDLVRLIAGNAEPPAVSPPLVAGGGGARSRARVGASSRLRGYSTGRVRGWDLGGSEGAEGQARWDSRLAADDRSDGGCMPSK